MRAVRWGATHAPTPLPRTLHPPSAAHDAEKHRLERGEGEPKRWARLLVAWGRDTLFASEQVPFHPPTHSPHKSGLGSHVDIGGVADYGPVDTERMNQPDTRDIPARVP